MLKQIRENKINLYGLPFAGGSSYSLRGLKKFMPGEIEFIPIEYSGRGRRISEPLLHTVKEIVSDILHQLTDQLDQPYAFYGHSMGTIIGYLLAVETVKQGLPQPLHLFVSGRGGPSMKMDVRKTYHLPPFEFINQLKRMGGVPDEILRDDEVMLFFEEILRADFEAIENYHYEYYPKLTVPICVMHGNTEKISAEDLMLWQHVTTVPIKKHEFTGGHFFILDHFKDIANIISQTLKTSSNNETNIDSTSSSTTAAQ